MSEHMIFVLGNPRSGTTLLRLMLTSHQEICIPPECGFIQWWHSKYGDWSSVDSKDEDKVDDFLADLSTSKKIENWELDYEVLKTTIFQQNPENYADLCSLVIVQYAHQQNKQPKYVGDKNNYYLNHLPLLKSLYPEAKFIAIIRDGRDVACSYRKIKKLDTESPYKPKLPTEISAIADEWIANIEKVDSLFNELPESQKTWVRYEDVVSTPAQVMEELSTFMGLLYDENMIHYYETETQYQKEPDSTLDWKKKTLSKPDASNTGKFVDELSESEIQRFNSIASGKLKRFGYE